MIVACEASIICTDTSAVTPDRLASSIASWRFPPSVTRGPAIKIPRPSLKVTGSRSVTVMPRALSASSVKPFSISA